MDKIIESTLLSATQSKKILSVELVQSLWSGYGSLIRVNLDHQSVIVKQINFSESQNHPKGWQTDFSHNRKVKSYLVEKNWYENFNKKILDAYSPQLILSLENEQNYYLILEDLKEKSFIPKDSFSHNEVRLCLKWLANFHARYMGTKPDGLWKIGTYWHLETRPDELRALDHQELREAASQIDQKLNSSKYQTLVHGDAKLANFLFKADEVSAVDFQYVGGGVGVKDLIYFLSSIYNEVELEKYQEQCLSYYFQELKQGLKNFHPELNFPSIEKDWRGLYPYAFCDFYRFLKGWSPKHYKLNSYSNKLIKGVLDALK